MDNDKTKIKLIERFLSELKVEGICGFWVDDDEEDTSQVIQVIIFLDIDWIETIPTKPEFIAKRMRMGIQEEIKKWLGLDVKVGSTAKKCD